MKKYIVGIILAIALTGCWNSGTVKNDDIDLDFLAKQCPVCEECTPPEVIACPTEEEVIYGVLNELADQIDVTDVVMKHYVDEVEVEVNTAEVIDNNGTVITKNAIKLPPYQGQPMRHVLIIEFYQVK